MVLLKRDDLQAIFEQIVELKARIGALRREYQRRRRELTRARGHARCELRDGDGTTSAKKEDRMFDISKALDRVDDIIETAAKAELPGETTARAVAKYLETPAGQQMYALHEALHRAGTARPAVDPNMAALEALAETAMARDPSLTPARAYERAFDQLS